MIGIIGAMESETNKIKGYMNNVLEEKRGPFLFYTGSITGKDIVLVQSFEGKINSAMCTQLMIDMYSPEQILNIGVAGGLSKMLEIGGIAVSSATVEFDQDTTALGYEPGFTFGLNKVYIDTNNNIANKIYEVAKTSNNVQMGVIASSDRFVTDDETKKILQSKYNAIAVDMETASINHVCALNHIDFCAIRGISDNGNKQEFMEFVDMAMENINEVIFEYLKM